MARLTIEPVYTSSTGTHKSLIISGHDLLGSTRPNWVISLETDESDAETVETLISTLEGYFNQPQNDHTSAKLYQLIVRHLPQSQNYSISALVFDNTSLHLLSFGNVQVNLKRINREAILLDSKKADWSIIKGKWLINDVFEVSVGKSKIEICIKDSEPEPDLEPNPNLNDKQDLIEKPKKRFIMILGFIVLALLIVSVFFGAKDRT